MGNTEPEEFVKAKIWIQAQSYKKEMGMLKVLFLGLLASRIDAKNLIERRAIESADDNVMAESVAEVSEPEREIPGSPEESDDTSGLERELVERLIDEVEEEMEKRTKRPKEPCYEGICTISDCTSIWKKKYIELQCPNGKTPHVDSSVYGWWKAKGHRCYRKKGECPVD